MADRIHLKKIGYFLLSRYLYLIHCLNGRRLELRFISEPQALLFGNSYFTLYIEVYGCHQIIINNRIKLPGNITEIRLDASRLSGSLVLCFQGCRQNIVKVYPHSPIYLYTRQLADVVLEEPVLQIRQPLLPEKLREVQLPSVDLPAAFRVRTSALAFGARSPLLQVQLESCQIPQYNP